MATAFEVGRNAALQAWIDLLDASTAAVASLTYETSSASAIAVLNFGSVSFASVSGGVTTANAIGDGTAAIGGTITNARIADGDGTAFLLAGAGTASAEFILSEVVVTAGTVIGCTAITLTWPAT